MGNYFKTKPKDKLNKEMIEFLKSRKLQHINDEYTYFQLGY
ncbi:unnamed protein product [Paramecium sonneborni]|uniref:Uncharacterized protein n=1 Tax=Paramecium sonneborni TaxID=65129 RepID=A0A8S1Q3B8_9CILI|nr:unnamed protein product [Paramecium sonneborni]